MNLSMPAEKVLFKGGWAIVFFEMIGDLEGSLKPLKL
jgi:hypothetical protein